MPPARAMLPRSEPGRTVSVAPMMDCTDRHCRFFMRLLSRRVLLYTEMIPSAAIVHGRAERLLSFHPAEHPVAVQLGGSDPRELAESARRARDFGYDEVNLNVGCPSERVQSGRFGACLMAEPDLVARCVEAMARAVDIPVTVKTRIGIDNRDSYAHLRQFVSTVGSAGCGTFIVHARKAWLKGLSPKENREKPPLRYEVVRRLKADFPRLQMVLNGGITTLQQARDLLEGLDGVMIGREAYRNPYILAGVDGLFYGHGRPAPDRSIVVETYRSYMRERMEEGAPPAALLKPLIGLYQGLRGARSWRRGLSEAMGRPGLGPQALDSALEHVEPQRSAA